MMDYNFFEGYKVKKHKSSVGNRIFNIIFAVLIICMLAFVGFNYYRILSLNDDIASVNQKIEDIKQTEDIGRILEKEALLAELDAVVASMEAAGEDIRYNSAIDDQLLAAISDTLPVDVKLNSLEINNRDVEIRGSGASKPAIAEMVYGLREIEIFKDMSISQMTKSEEGNAYNFGLTFRVGGDVHEDQ